MPVRLLTLTGVAGCGKTRLALVVAEEVHDAYPDGVWLVELAPLPATRDADAARIAAGILAALRLPEQPGTTPLEALTGQIGAQRMLLILDNCEHVVTAAATLAERMLAACAGVQILTTSQYPLGIASEIVWHVDTLDLPEAVEGTPSRDQLERLEHCETVQLFVERARAARPNFMLDTSTATSTATICRQLDGLPLSIELAATRLNTLSIDELSKRLADRFRVLRRGGHRVADRHQTLQATVDWSYHLLASSDRVVLQRLAVFSGGWEIAAAEAVCSSESIPEDLILEALDELRAHSMVYVSKVDGTPRYRMLETVRHYGLQQLQLADEVDIVRDRHLNWCLALAEEAELLLQGAGQGTWLARLGREYDNLRSALQWALDRGPTALGLRLAVGLWQFWRSHGYLREGRHWLAAALALPFEDDDDATKAVRATLLERAAWLAEDDHAFADASALFAQSEALRRALGQTEDQSGPLLIAAMEARARGDYARATDLAQDSLAQHRAEGNRESIKGCGLGLSLARLALLLAEQGEHARANDLYEECLALHRELGDQEGIGKCLLGLGDIARDLGETARVRALCEETLTLFRELDHNWVGFSLNNLAQASYLDGDLVQAAEQAEASAAIFRSLHAGPSLSEALVTLGRIKGMQGQPEAALTSLSEGLRLAWREGPRLILAAALEAMAVEMVRQGEAEPAVQTAGAAAELRREMGAPVRPADQPELDSALSKARRTLDAAEFDAAWTRGHTVSVEQVVKLPGALRSPIPSP